MVNLTFSADELIRYSRHIKLHEIGLSGQAKLKNARVLCIGLGGLGSPLLLYLTAAGIGTLGLVDDDIVEPGNLQRQILYQVQQVTYKKTVAASAQLLALNPAITVNTYAEKLTEHNAAHLISQYDIIVDGSDNFYTRYLINDVCFELHKPYVYASASEFQGYCSIFYGTGPCLRCLFPIPPIEGAISDCAAGGVLNVLPGILGIMQATEIIKWILRIGNSLEKRLLIIDLLKMTFREIHIAKDPDCKLCNHGQSINKFTPDPHDKQHIYAVTAELLLELLQKNNDITLIDVRSETEHAMQNIGGKIIPLTDLPHRLQELDLNHNIVLYCRSGKRSLLALEILLEAGFTSVKYLLNGIDAIYAQNSN